MKQWWPGIGEVNRLAPGVYSDVVGNVHLEVGEMIRYLGAQDTPANRQLVAEHLTAETGRLGTRLPIEAGGGG